MRVALLSAASINGMITGGRGRRGHELESFLGTPREVVAHKAEIRRRHGAILVGTGTVLVDDPTLTSHAVPGFRCVRATLDRTGRIPRTARFFDGSARTLVGTCDETPREYLDFLAERGVEAVPSGEEGIDLAAFLAGLKERGITSVACEGGGVLHGALLEQGLVERIYLLVLPAVLDAGSVKLFDGTAAAARLRLEGVERAGDYLWLEYAVI
jgi:diaminohydroxyphosphoribosylaminopyrimidine deaminase/5-amino-6-(5-phosphoribosylamino)uracil reductase